MSTKTQKVVGVKVTRQCDGPLPSVPVPGFFLGNDSSRNFAKLGESFLEAAKFTDQGFQNRLEWPTLFLAFQALELYLKAFLLSRGRKLEYLHKTIGHNLERALDDAKAEGLALKSPAALEKLVMEVGESYLNKDFQYRSMGSFTVMLPHALIGFVEHVRQATGN